MTILLQEPCPWDLCCCSGYLAEECIFVYTGCSMHVTEHEDKLWENLLDSNLGTEQNHQQVRWSTFLMARAEFDGVCNPQSKPLKFSIEFGVF
jgi:hypothetical protein